jgi:hypothetical protein
LVSADFVTKIGLMTRAHTHSYYIQWLKNSGKAKEFKDVFPAEVPSGLPHLRGIEHKIDLILQVTLPNRVAYRTNPEEAKEIQ